MNYYLYNIPKHNCKNCGKCCGPVPINEEEYNTIKNFVIKNKPITNKNNDFFTCKFRINNKCSIYEVRPILCRLMGVCKGLECNDKNSFFIDGKKFLDLNKKIVGFINDVIDTNY